MRTRTLMCLTLVASLLMGMPGPASAAGSTGTTERVSVATGGAQADSTSGAPSISADGRHVAFFSAASNLVPGDTNASSDIFVRDRQTGATERVSVATGGGQANGASHRPSISADGRYVAFYSVASNLVAGDTSLVPDVFVHDRQTGTTERVSVANDGAQSNSTSEDPSISADGRHVAFVSHGSNLVPGDTNANGDIFVHDRQTGATERVSLATGGAQADQYSADPSISADGRHVTFRSASTNLVAGDTNGNEDVFVRDRQTGSTNRVSIATNGTQSDSLSVLPSISADGRLITFYTQASTLVAGDSIGTYDVFLHDRQTGATERISVAHDGTPANGISFRSKISADGRHIAFRSFATNLVAGGSSGGFGALFVHDRQTGTNQPVGLASDGTQANGFSNELSISADGRHVAFDSSASNLVVGDTNAQTDIFVWSAAPPDTTPPVLSLPANLTIEATSTAGATVSYTATATDTTDPSPVVVCTQASGSTFAIGDTAVTCDATDAAGNTTTGSFTVTVVDTTAPTLALPDQLPIEANSPAGTTVSYLATATDTADPNPTVTCTPASGTTFAIGTTPVACTATDTSGNTATGSFTATVNLIDATAPTLSLPGPLTLEATGPAGATATYTAAATDTTDPDPDPTVSCTPASGATFAIGTTTVACDATDAAGNSATGSFTVTVEDTTAPTLTVPEATTATTTSQAGTAVSYTATATDIADLDPTVSCIPASGTTFAIGTTTVACTATDAAGNTVTGSFIVTVTFVDADAPTLSLPAPLTVEATSPAGAIVSYTATATDTTDPNPTVSCNPASGTVLTIGATFPLGATTVTCTATDATGNIATGSFTITVKDTTAPTLTVPEATTATTTSPAGATVSYTATATDLADPNPTVSCTPASGVVFAIGTTTVACTATDAAGNTATGSFSVTVNFVDASAPTLSLQGPLTLEATSAAGATVSYIATATDPTDPAPAVSCTPASGTTFTIGTTTVGCTATDATGNTATGSFTVTVEDTTDPTLTLPDPLTVQATSPAGATITYTATATDTVDPNPDVSCTPASGTTFTVGTTFALGTTTVDCTAIDASGNTTTSSFTVTVEDTTVPTLTLPGLLAVQAASPAGATVSYTATAADTADPNPTVSCTPASGTTFVIGTTTVTCTATDATGNTATGSFTIMATFTFADTTAPTLSLPGATTVNAASPAGANVSYTATATDTADPNPTVTCTRTSGTTFAIGTTTVTCTATDATGNTATGSFTVTVNGTAAQVSNLATLIRSYNLPAGTAQDLLTRMTAVQRELTRGRVNDACGKLADFTSKVSDLRAKRKLTVAQGTQLTAEASRIRTVLNCR